jgi:hypothetical protein
MDGTGRRLIAESVVTLDAEIKELESANKEAKRRIPAFEAALDLEIEARKECETASRKPQTGLRLGNRRQTRVVTVQIVGLDFQDQQFPSVHLKCDLMLPTGGSMFSVRSLAEKIAKQLCVQDEENVVISSGQTRLHIRDEASSGYLRNLQGRLLPNTKFTLTTSMVDAMKQVLERMKQECLHRETAIVALRDHRDTVEEALRHMDAALFPCITAVERSAHLSIRSFLATYHRVRLRPDPSTTIFRSKKYRFAGIVTQSKTSGARRFCKTKFQMILFTSSGSVPVNYQHAQTIKARPVTLRILSTMDLSI